MKIKILTALLAGIVLLAACSGNKSYNKNDIAKADTITTDSVKLVKTADMRFKVKNVLYSAEVIAGMTRDCGGIVTHHDLQSNIVDKQDITLANDSVKKLTVYNTTASITVKVPMQLAEAFMDSLNHLGTYVDERKMEVEDKSLDFLSEKLKAENREASVKLRGRIRLSTRTADSILALKDDAVDRKISNLRTDDAARFTVISLQLYQNNSVNKEVVANDNISDYHETLPLRFKAALSHGWYFFSTLIIGVVNLWPFVLLGCGIWLIIYFMKKKKRDNAEMHQPGI